MLTQWFKEGCKEKDEWRVGTEHEKFAYNYLKITILNDGEIINTTTL